MTRMSDPLARRVLSFCEKWDMLPRGALVLCAVSGGRDSMAMLHLLSALTEEGGFRVAAAHFNHRLRPTADRDEEFVRSWCGENGIPLETGSGDVQTYAQESGTGIEDAARQLRYRFLSETANKLNAARITTAHHREDNTETVLLHLLRGTGLQGLGGIAPVRGRIVRPLLETGRGEINEYIIRNTVPYVEDESNQDIHFTRNRLRLEVLPLLEEIAPGCGGRIAAAAELLREEENHFRRETEALLPEIVNDSVTLPVPTLNRQDEAMRRRLVRAMGQRLGAELTKTQVEAVLALRSGGYQDLSENLCAIRKPHQLILKKQPSPLPPLALHEGEQTWGPWLVTVRQGREIPVESENTVILCGVGGNLTIASWDGKGRLAVENGSRTIKRLFADAGIPIEDRADYPALFLDGKPVAIFGVATDYTFRPRAEEPCTVITLHPASKCF